MQMNGNTILITGGGSGIGRALAEAFHALGNQVIIAGRRQEALDETVQANPGIKSVVLDIGDAGAIRSVAAGLVREYPDLNAVILNAGIMRSEDIRSGDLTDAEATIATNLLGPVRLTAALLPQLLSRPQATIMTVSSGLAFVPMATTPTYNATKAAIHSYTQSLRYQLKDTPVQVIELVPPYVRTGLQGQRQANDPHAMPLDEYVAETMSVLTHSPDVTEVLVERVGAQRFAERSGTYDTFYKTFNDAVWAAAGH